MVASPRSLAVRDTLIGAGVALFVASPAIFTSLGFGPDFTNHIWLIWQQGQAIAYEHHPTLYLQSAGPGIFQPFYGFYGGTLYAIAGAISALLGQRPELVFVGSIVVFTGMAYRGVWLLSRQAGVSRLLAHVPAVVFTTSAYLLTDIYARGAWPEFAALSALPFALGYGVRLLRADWTAGSVLGFGWGVVLLSGSHNITLLYSTLLLVVFGTVAWLVLGADRPPLLSIAKVAGVTVTAVGVNAWFLVLDVRHSNDVVIAHSNFPWSFTEQFDKPAAILTPFRSSPESTTFHLTVAAPVLALVIAIVLVAVRRRWAAGQPRALRRLWVVCAGLIVVLLWMMMMPGSWWSRLGSQLNLIQFPYRLSGWVALAVALLLALSLRLTAGGGARAKRTILAVAGALMLVTAIQAAVQIYGFSGDPIASRDRSMALANGPTTPPDSWYDVGGYRDTSRPLLTNLDPSRAINLPAPRPGARRFTATGHLPPGPAPIRTNIAGGPYVVRVSGVAVLGRAEDGSTLIQRPPTTPVDAAVTITVTADAGPSQTVATIASLVCLLLLVLLVAGVGLRGRRRRRDDDGGDPDETAADGDVLAARRAHRDVASA